MDISKVLTMGYPGEEWSLAGDNYEGLVWHSQSKKPSLEDIEAMHQSLTESGAYEQAVKLPLTDEARAILLLLRSINVLDQQDAQEKAALLVSIADKYSSTNTTDGV